MALVEIHRALDLAPNEATLHETFALARGGRCNAERCC